MVDETGKVISERKSNRVYVAATTDGKYYFGRLDLIGKGDHGKDINHGGDYKIAYKKESWKYFL